MKKSILFVGNSYTFYHDMPQCIFAPMAAEAGYEMDVRSVTCGGYKLEWYADQENAEGKRLREVIADRHFDCIVLQDHSLSTITDPAGFFSGIRAVKTLLEEHTDRFVLYSTWARKPGCPTLDEIGMTPREMTRHIAEHYDEAARRFRMEVAHVGRAFEAYSLEHPEAELYFEDLHHSSALGSTIAAETILSTVTGLSVEAIRFRCAAGRADRTRNAATVHPEGVRCIPDIPYGPHGIWNLLDLHKPEGAEERLPVIVSIHGGGYVYGTRGIYHHYCADLARRGFAVVNFNYRLAPEAKFPAQLEDISAAFRWVKENAEAYGLDLDRLFVVGDSAGAQLASQYAAMVADRDYAALFDFEVPDIRIRGLGLNGGMFDLPEKLASPTFRLGRDYLGEGFELSNPRLDVFAHIGEGYPPCHITTATGDFNRPGAEPFACLLRERGIDAEVRCYGREGERELGHVFHVDIRLEEAKVCNDAQCAFFTKYMY